MLFKSAQRSNYSQDYEVVYTHGNPTATMYNYK